MEGLTRVIDRLLGWYCVLLSVFLVCTVVWQVFTRYVLNDPSTWTDELSRYVFIWVSLMAATYTLGQRRHLAIDLLGMNMSGRGKARLNIIIDTCTLAFALLILVYGGGRLTLYIMQSGQVSPAIGYPFWLVYLAVPVAGLLMALYTLRDLSRSFRGLARPDSLDKPHYVKE
jgi:TRAP-type C4-dicarboxylate transport system permease small subunit